MSNPNAEQNQHVNEPPTGAASGPSGPPLSKEALLDNTSPPYVEAAACPSRHSPETENATSLPLKAVAPVKGRSATKTADLAKGIFPSKSDDQQERTLSISGVHSTKDCPLLQTSPSAKGAPPLVLEKKGHSPPIAHLVNGYNLSTALTKKTILSPAASLSENSLPQTALPSKRTCISAAVPSPLTTAPTKEAFPPHTGSLGNGLSCLGTVSPAKKIPSPKSADATEKPITKGLLPSGTVFSENEPPTVKSFHMTHTASATKDDSPSHKAAALKIAITTRGSRLAKGAIFDTTSVTKSDIPLEERSASSVISTARNVSLINSPIIPATKCTFQLKTTHTGEGPLPASDISFVGSRALVKGVPLTPKSAVKLELVAQDAKSTASLKNKLYTYMPVLSLRLPPTSIPPLSKPPRLPLVDSEASAAPQTETWTQTVECTRGGACLAEGALSLEKVLLSDGVRRLKDNIPDVICGSNEPLPKSHTLPSGVPVSKGMLIPTDVLTAYSTSKEQGLPMPNGNVYTPDATLH